MAFAVAIAFAAVMRFAVAMRFAAAMAFAEMMVLAVALMTLTALIKAIPSHTKHQDRRITARNPVLFPPLQKGGRGDLLLLCITSKQTTRARVIPQTAALNAAHAYRPNSCSKACPKASQAP
ncbi:hypothetical protein [Lysobacter capsici]|uniref:hypothetical protein n=1 Tax=Lysobacter capsici TaxID=435897 RepID=UPI001C004DCB|nr:hypothetical protein [Lysobacter capsici]QWF17708.1 hypothetical protein KME82_02625 [Lysobacter capsici]